MMLFICTYIQDDTANPETGLPQHVVPVVLHHPHESIVRISLLSKCQPRLRAYTGTVAYHRFDIRMWDSIKLVELELEIMLDIDVSALVLCTVTVLRCGEDCQKSASMK